MSLSRAEAKRIAKDHRRKWLKRTIWFITTVTVAGTLGSWLWDWTGTPVFLK